MSAASRNEARPLDTDDVAVIRQRARTGSSAGDQLASAAEVAAGIRRGPFGPKEQRVTHLSVVDPTQRTAIQRRRRAVIIGTSLTLAFFVMLLGLAAFQAVLVQHQRHLDDVDKALKTELSRNEQLMLQSQLLQRPNRIISQAQANGMVEPPQYTYIRPPSEVVAAFDAAQRAKGNRAP